MVSAITILICLVHDEWHTSIGTWNKMDLSVGQIISCSVPLCIQEICFSHASLGLQKKKNNIKKRNKNDELAVEVFFGVGDSDGQDRCIWQSKARRAIGLIQILFYLHLKPQSHFQKHFGRNLLVRELLCHKR